MTSKIFKDLARLDIVGMVALKRQISEMRTKENGSRLLLLMIGPAGVGRYFAISELAKRNGLALRYEDFESSKTSAYYSFVYGSAPFVVFCRSYRPIGFISFLRYRAWETFKSRASKALRSRARKVMKECSRLTW